MRTDRQDAVGQCIDHAVSVNISPRNATILRYALPQTGLEAKFSVQFAVTCPIVAGRPGLAELTDEFVRRAEVQALMQRVVVMRVERDDPNLPGYAIYHQTIIETRDGWRLEGPRVSKIRGRPDLPLSRVALWAKFDDCMRFGGVEESEQLFDTLFSLDKLGEVAELIRWTFPSHRAADS